MAVNAAARMWSPYKELYHVVDSAICRKQADAIQELEIVLRKHKPDFISLLQNPAKNTTHREAVKKADKVGLAIQGQQTPHILTPQFIDEALIISDLFNLNEYAAVELLLTGENQQSYFPGLTRGLVAVVLFYDGRASLINALRLLIQSRRGRTFSLGGSDELVALTTRFTDEIMREGLCGKIIGLLRTMDVEMEEDKLNKERALGHARYREQCGDRLDTLESDIYRRQILTYEGGPVLKGLTVLVKMKEIRFGLAECLFYWCCQTPLNQPDMLQLLNHLRDDPGSGKASDGSICDVTLALLMGALYCMDIRLLEQEDSEEVAEKLPILADPNFLPEVHRDIVSAKIWANPGMKALVQFTWAQTLRSLSQYSSSAVLSEYCEQDEVVVDMAVEEGVFSFITNSILSIDNFHKEEYYLRQLHNNITDFVVQMPLKVKELRNRGDEAARIILAHLQEGLEPSANLKRDFERFMEMMFAMYEKDPLELQLALEYWCPPEPVGNADGSAYNTVYNYRPPQRKISLFKFVRLAGDLLSPPLYIPYICMLTGLATGPQCAHHCFSLLKSGQVNTVSWDHFFNSLNKYYSSLRQEAPTPGDLAHVYRHYPRGITPQEAEGLTAVLNLIRVIAEQDESSRISLCENQQWLPSVVLVGLVGCSVPPNMKAVILKTLAALARTPELAAKLWQAIEVAQILPTVSSTSIHQSGGIQTELEEVESRNEEYPLTLAFLQLMNALTEDPVPAGLGVGYRHPGFQPYLEFLRDSIFLKFNTRAYKNPAEKWQVGSAVLSVLYKLLSQYQVSPDDVAPESPAEQSGSSHAPGQVLLLHLLNDTPTLKMVLYILDEAVKQLDKHIEFPGRRHLEQSALLCLRILEAVLERQQAFLHVLRETSAPTMVSSLDKLLTSINPRSGRADHLTKIAKYITYNATLPEHSLSSVKILCWVCQSALVQPKLVGLFTANSTESNELLHGFVECLEADDPEDVEETDPEEDNEAATTSQIRTAIRQNILRLLMSTLEQPTPNLAHFLLGFELRKPVSKTNLQDPGILDSPRTCLHSVLTLLERGLETRTANMGNLGLQTMPRSAELAYHLIYLLCADKEACSPTMRYLRTAHDFLFRHLKQMPFHFADHTDQEKKHDGIILQQQSWLLKSVAIELRLTTVNRQRSHTQRLLNILLDDTPAADIRFGQGDGEMSCAQFDMEYSMYGSMHQAIQQQTLPGTHSRRKILSLLDMIDFTQDYPPTLDLEFFNCGQIEQVISSCEQPAEGGVKYCDIRGLHQILVAELNNLQGAMAGQRPHIMQEIKVICSSVVERNSFRSAVWQRRTALEAWRQVVEVMLNACPLDLLSGEHRQALLFELLQDLFMKVSKDGAIPELTMPVAGVILTLMANLRQCFLEEETQAQLDDLAYYPSLEGQCAGRIEVGFGQSTGARTFFASSLQVVLRGLIDHIIHSSGATQRVRANLYGALLYYLQIAHKPKSLTSGLENEVDNGVGGKLSSKESEYEKLSRENLTTISSYGHSLMEVVCRDASDGHQVGRMLALAALDCVLRLDRPQGWLAYMTNKGYIQHVVDTLLQDDQELQAMLQPDPEPLRVLYIFESKIGLLTRVAESATGAHTLLQCSLMTRLSECSIFDLRPEGDRPSDSFVPGILSRYRHHILFPVLKLCLAVLTSTGIENRQAASQVLRFIVAHVDVVSAILADRPSALKLQSLQELALVTAVLSRAALDEGEEDLVLGDTATVEFRGHLSRLHRQMLALLPRYCLSDKLMKEVKNLEMTSSVSGSRTSTGPEGRDLKTKIQLALLEVSSNVTAFCRTITSQSGPQNFRILFGPSLMEAMARDLRAIEEVSTVSSVSRPQNLGMVVFLLRQCCQQFMVTFDGQKQNTHKLHNLADLSAEELKELCGIDSGSGTDSVAAGAEKLSTQQKQQLARKQLLQITAFNAQQMQLFSYMIENCLYILWKHLEFYLLHCVPMESGTTLYRINANKQAIRRLQDVGAGPSYEEEVDIGGVGLSAGVSSDQLQQLKLDANTCVNDTLLKKVQEIEQCYCRSRSRYGFVEALVRRIRRLLRLHTRRT